MPVEKRSEKRIKKNYFLNLKKKFILGEKSHFLTYVTPRLPMNAYKKISPFSPAVWPASENICTNVLFFYIDKYQLVLWGNFEFNGFYI